MKSTNIITEMSPSRG